MFRLELIRIDLEELNRFLWMLSGDIVKGEGGDVIGLSFADERVVFQEVFDFRGVGFGLRLQEGFGFVSGTWC
jgi:hypothetical protein